MRTLIIVVVTAVALASAGAAQAGCWATAGVSPQPPGTAGTPWNASIRIMQHGRTPMTNASPTLTIRNAETGASKTFRAEPTERAGVYRADVVFPSGGAWRYEVNDGFPVRECAQTHTFAPVDITGGSGSSSSLWTIAGAAGLAVLLGVLLFAALRLRRRPALAPSVH